MTTPALTDAERDAMTEAGMDLLKGALKEMDERGIPKGGQFAFLLNMAAHIGLDQMGMDVERLTTVTLRCFALLAAEMLEKPKE